MENINVVGGESVYCINENQLKKAYELATSSAGGGAKIKEYLALLEKDLNRNERAALAFVLIDHLLKSA